MEDNLEPKVNIHTGELNKRIKISVTFTLSMEEWEGFVQHAEKTGGALTRKLADVVKPEMQRVRDLVKAFKSGES